MEDNIVARVLPIEQINAGLPAAEREVRKLLQGAHMMEAELREIGCAQARYERIISAAHEGLPSRRPPDAMPWGKGNHADPTANAVVDIADWYQEQCQRLKKRVRELTLHREVLDELMECLSQTQRRVIAQRWIAGKSWAQVSRAVFLCERQAQRISNGAIELMARRYVAVI